MSYLQGAQANRMEVKAMEEMDTTSAIISEELVLFLEVVQLTHVLVSLTLDLVDIQEDSMEVKKTSACQKEDKEIEKK